MMICSGRTIARRQGRGGHRRLVWEGMMRMRRWIRLLDLSCLDTKMWETVYWNAS